LPIITVTSKPKVANQLALIYANSAFFRAYSEDFGFELAKELKASGYLQTDDNKKDLLAVIVSGNRDQAGTDTIKVRRV